MGHAASSGESSLNILVTGGAGFIGSHTTDALIEKGHRVRILKYNQTGDNLLRLASQLYDDIRFAWLTVYDAPDLRQHVLNAQARETDRGWRLTRKRAKAKIDGAISLGGSVVLATDFGPRDCQRRTGLTLV